MLELAAEGLIHKEIANRMCISALTVKNHLVAIFDALGPRTVAGAVAKALRDGLIE